MNPAPPRPVQTLYRGVLPTLPVDAWGFIAPRSDRPERLALYRRDGVFRTSFAQDLGVSDVACLIVATYPGAGVGEESIAGFATVWGLPTETSKES